MHSDFDVCSVLAIIEFAINCLAQCAMILAVHSIASDKHLHGNFKFVLCLALSRTLLNFIRRIFANYWTLFWTDAIKEDFLVLYKCISIFTSMLLSISMQLVAMERLLYTYNIANYEKTHATACSLAFCAAFLILSSLGITLCDNTLVPIAFQFAAPMFTLGVLSVVYHANHSRRRPHRSLSLDEKSMANQTMNSVRLFLPPMICSSAFSVVHGALTLGKFVALSEEFGYSESIMNAIVGITIALDDLLTPSIAYFCHRHLKGRASRRIASELRNASIVPDDYFKQFEKAWKIGDSLILEMEIKVSSLGLALSIVEFWPYIPSLILIIIAYNRVIKCAKMTCCLRVLLCLLLLRTPINAIRRSVVLIERVFFIGEEALLPQQELNNAVLYFTWYLICFSMVLLCLERLFVTVYRPTTAGIANDPTTCTLIVAIVLLSSLTAGYWEKDVPMRYVQIGTFLVTSPILVVLYRTNRKWRNTKLTKPLETKCSFEENMLGIRAVLPLLVHINICSLLTLALVEYQAQTSKYELGYDMTIINNFYGLLIAWECLWSPLLLLHNFYRISKDGYLFRKQCAHRDTDAERLAHFDSLRVTWERAERTRSNPEIFTVETSL